MAYAGLQGGMGAGLFYELFAARLSYRYAEGGGEVRATQEMLTPMMGIRWGRRWHAAAAVGPGAVRREETGARQRKNERIGLTIKGSVSASPGAMRIQLLGSFASLERMSWGRARVLRATSPHVAFGGEAIGLRGDQARSHGAGLVLVVRGGPGSVGVAFGYERSTNRKDTSYGGIELSALF